MFTEFEGHRVWFPFAEFNHFDIEGCKYYDDSPNYLEPDVVEQATYNNYKKAITARHHELLQLAVF